MGSDGVFDNLFDEQIMEHCIEPKIAAGGHLKDINDAALCVSSLAEVWSYSKTHVSPYTQSAMDHGKKKEDELGGKPDDITVIVAQIKTQQL